MMNRPLEFQAHEALLLRAALVPASAASAAWISLLKLRPLENFSPEWIPLLPTVFRNLSPQLNLPEGEKLAGIYRHSWSRNALLRARLEEIAALLRAHNLSAVPSGETASAFTFAPDPGVRPGAGPLTLRVAPGQARSIMEILCASGGRPDGAAIERPSEIFHGARFLYDPDIFLRLDWGGWEREERQDPLILYLQTLFARDSSWSPAAPLLWELDVMNAIRHPDYRPGFPVQCATSSTAAARLARLAALMPDSPERSRLLSIFSPANVRKPRLSPLLFPSKVHAAAFYLRRRWQADSPGRFARELITRGCRRLLSATHRAGNA